MKKFKVLTIILFISVLLIPDIKAQWNKDISQNLLVSKENDIHEESVKLVGTKDDNMFITWLSWENLNNQPNYFFKMQILDKAGNPRLKQGGTFICTQPTYTWTSGYDIDYTPDDCLLFTTTDNRNNNLSAYIYKISQKGEQLWGQEGIELMSDPYAGIYSPKICVYPDGISAVSFVRMDEKSSLGIIAKLSPEGKKMTETKIKNAGKNNIIPCDKNSLFAAWVEDRPNLHGNLYIQKFSNDLQPIYPPTTIDTSNKVVKDAAPNIISDGQGGFIISWKNNIAIKTVITKIQRVDPMGNPLFKEEIHTSSDAYGHIIVDKQNQWIYTAIKKQVDNYYNLIIEKYNFYGEKISEILFDKDILGYNIYAMILTPENDLSITYNANRLENQQYIIYNKLIDPKGYLSPRTKEISISKYTRTDGSAIMLNNGEIITAWSEDRTNIKDNYCGAIYAQNIPYKYATNEINSETSKQTSVTVYPNPAQNEIYIKPETDFENQTIRIFITDMYGQTISELYSGILNETKQFDISGLKQGIYFIKTENSGQSTVNKLIISK